ncbi:ADP-ribosylglycohydrolase family protein [Emticicia sp. C21]|uniref:ADP-ribosylglycohydrolase family protein n=1 Tax=Emticicia sp. C21 TaxID=2302915 RepID=UPI000E344F7A|nr:ADP-ribosylglycohydrolase family protein [Emticicia sp. C21]RFS15773.1 ADP-ribosylglycohydrolase family protein [Emticicia sp. C21]
MKSLIHSALFGVAVGDALGVPVEFKSREYLKQNPVTFMTGYGTHGQPAGTWSDDSSLTFCLAEMLCKGYDLKLLAQLFVGWYNAEVWTPHGKVFDIGIATSQAIHSLSKGITPTLAGGTGEESNGNGSLMRILSLVFYTKDLPIKKRFQIVKEVSSLTHAHIRSVLGCFIYTEMALQIMALKDKWKAYAETVKSVNDFLNNNAICSQMEIDKYHRILQNPIGNYTILPIHEYYEAEIGSSGYVLDTLEASFWCLFHTDNYKDAVLKAVNLGSDTDTTGAVTGGLAGLLYGYESIPNEWIDSLARKDDIDELGNRLALKTGL